MKLDTVDVIVLGAGAAGLAAASALGRAGLHALVLEARDRACGRVRTLKPSTLTAPIELGAEFVHGLAPRTLALAQQYRVPVAEVDGHHWTLGPNGFTQDGDWDAVFRFLRELRSWAEAHPDHDESFSAYCDRVAVTAALRTVVTSYVEGFHAADARVIGVQSLARLDAAAERLEEDRAFRLAGGYGALLEAMAQEIPAGALRLASPVTRVEWSSDGVLVSGPFGVARAKAAIVTLPVGVLRAETVIFEPRLESKAEALRGLRMGSALRVALRFDEAFWDEAVAEPAMFHAGVRANDVTFPTWWTARPQTSPHLVAWTGGPRADRLAGTSVNELRGTALRDLGFFFPAVAAALETRCREVWVHDWTTDPYARGAYSYAAVGGADAHRALAAPEPPLFFAGEATDASGDNGTVNGALASGERAAREAVAWVRNPAR